MDTAAKDFLENSRAARDALIEQGLSGGPVYAGDNETAPLVWHDQIFQREVSPAGDVLCETALRVGATQNGLDVILVASHSNGRPLRVPAGATITLVMLEADSRDGDFEETGPSVCVKAGPDGLEIDPDLQVCRFAIGNMKKPWAKAKVSFEGAITGGVLDVALAYAPR